MSVTMTTSISLDVKVRIKIISPVLVTKKLNVWNDKNPGISSLSKY